MNTVLRFLLPVYLAIVQVWLFVSPYKRDSHNPARRWCRRCGQREELYGYNSEHRFVPTGWEVMYPLSMDPCDKHRVGRTDLNPVVSSPPQ